MLTAGCCACARRGEAQLPHAFVLRVLHEARVRDRDVAALSKACHEALLTGDPRKLRILNARDEARCLKLLTQLHEWGRQHATAMSLAGRVPQLLLQARLHVVTHLALENVALPSCPDFAFCFPSLRDLRLDDVRGLGAGLDLRALTRLQALRVEACAGLETLAAGESLTKLHARCETLTRVVARGAALQDVFWWGRLPPLDLQAARASLRTLELDAQLRQLAHHIHVYRTKSFLQLPDGEVDLDLGGFTQLYEVDVYTYALRSLSVRGCAALRRLRLPPGAALTAAGCTQLTTLFGCWGGAQLAAVPDGTLRELELRGWAARALASLQLDHRPRLRYVTKLVLMECKLPQQFDHDCLPDGLEKLVVAYCRMESALRGRPLMDLLGCALLRTVVINDTPDLYRMDLNATHVCLRNLPHLAYVTFCPPLEALHISGCPRLHFSDSDDWWHGADDW